MSSPFEFETRFKNWQRGQASVEAERADRAFLNKPLPPTNDPRLFVPTKVLVLRPFMVKTTAVLPGEVVEIPYHVARDMIAIGKAELVEPGDNER